MRCVFIVYSKLLGLNTAGAANIVLLLSTRMLLLIKAAKVVVNLITL